MRNSYWGIAWESFKRLHGTLFTIADLVLTIVLWKLAPNATVSVVIVVPLALIFFVVTLVLVDAGMNALKTRNLPKVLYAERHSSQGVVCLLEPSELFSHEAVVSFFHKGDSGFEQLIGFGEVLNIQEDGRIQVALAQPIDGYEDTVKALSANEGLTLRRIIVKPTASMRMLVDSASRN